MDKPTAAARRLAGIDYYTSSTPTLAEDAQLVGKHLLDFQKKEWAFVDELTALMAKHGVRLNEHLSKEDGSITWTLDGYGVSVRIDAELQSKIARRVSIGE